MRICEIAEDFGDIRQCKGKLGSIFFINFSFTCFQSHTHDLEKVAFDDMKPICESTNDDVVPR